MKKILMLLMSAFLAISLVACGGNGSKTDQSKSTETENTEPADTANTKASDLSGELEYWSSYNETEGQATVLKAAAESFMKENPGVKINFTFNGRDNSKILPTSVQAGQKITMYDANAVNIINRFSNSNRDLGSYYEESYPTTGGKLYKEYTSPAMLGLAEKLGEGKLYYVPMNPQAFVFMYNKDLFEAAGITETPKTWDEFVEVCAKLKEAGYTPLTTDPSYSTGILGYYLSRLKGQDWVYELVNDETYEMWSDPAVLQAAEALEELASKGFYAENVSTVQFPQAQQEFVLMESIGMYLNGTWMPGEVSESVGDDFRFGQFAFPTVEGGVDDDTVTAFSSYGIGINKDATEEEAKAAFAFAVYVNTGQFDQMMVDEASALPVDPNNKYPGQLEDMAEIFENTKGNYVSQTAIATNSDNAQIIRSALVNLLSGATDAQGFIDEIKTAGQ